ncbi:DUF4279 domain-containing protein [Chryseobacterium oryzae]|uniref:DUF4279 domain-containing protein n=1 Tax=Chryseobacterium oryzae TaxID=2929799 RepID=A0ABY4BGY0_9FLAO|nr:DUF4279 domain-containing protein [Chryseobacterium oryzae]UOE37003.1 DUF4279 domain-containing protein [Chryseobacterium oryzae]
MTVPQIIEVIQSELKNKAWGITEQILEIHNPIFVDNKIQIENIVKNENEISVFIPIENEKFYLTFYINSEKMEIIGISTEPNISIYFKATSEELSETELQNFTKLEITKSWNKGELRKLGNTSHSFSCIIIEPNKKPNNFESKIAELIEELEKDKSGIQKLSENANGYIQVIMEFHNGNGMIGGPNLSEEIIKSLNGLKLSLDFDFYVSGNPYKS